MSNLKSMANIAKERLKRGMYTNAEKIKAKNAMNINSYFIKNISSMQKIKCNAEFKCISNEIDDEFAKKVYSMLSCNSDIYNPIGRLVDQNIYRNLSDLEKQYYILDIADKYNRIKAEYNQLNTKIS